MRLLWLTFLFHKNIENLKKIQLRGGGSKVNKSSYREKSQTLWCVPHIVWLVCSALSTLCVHHLVCLKQTDWNVQEYLLITDIIVNIPVQLFSHFIWDDNLSNFKCLFLLCFFSSPLCVCLLSISAFQGLTSRTKNSWWAYGSLHQINNRANKQTNNKKPFQYCKKMDLISQIDYMHCHKYDKFLLVFAFVLDTSIPKSVIILHRKLKTTLRNKVFFSLKRITLVTACVFL